MSPDCDAIISNIGEDVHQFAGKTVLIAGGAGFLGRHFITVFRQLNETVLAKPCKVISVDNFITGRRFSEDSKSAHDENIFHVWADIVHPLPLREKLDYIIHAAGVASPVYYLKYPIETIESAVHGTKSLLELAKSNPDLEGFLYFSSSEIYGDPDPDAIPTPESYHGYVSSVGPRACYDESKRLGETLATVYAERHAVPVSIVRPFNVFGPGMGHDDRRVIPMFTYKSLNRLPIPIHGSGKQTRTYCYITDAIAGFIKVLLKGRPGEAYNIGNSDNEMSVYRLAELFTELVPNSQFQLIDYPSNYPAGEPQRRCPDLSKANTELHYKAKVSVSEGLSNFIEWAKTQNSYLNPNSCI